MLTTIDSGQIILENVLSMRLSEWLVILVGSKIYGIKELGIKQENLNIHF